MTLDRRSISYVVLLKESASNTDEEILLRQQVFERLNTGGVELENQEVRHCIYHNQFDDLLLELSHHPAMRRPWKLPLHTSQEEGNPPDELLKSSHYAKMKDTEFILRFFALRHVQYYRGGMQSFLDAYMVRSRRFNDGDIRFLKDLFTATIELAEQIYQDKLFRPFVPAKQTWSTTPQIAYADSLMVVISELLNQRDRLLAHRDDIILASKNLIANAEKGLFTGQGNTKLAIEKRLNAFREMMTSTIA